MSESFLQCSECTKNCLRIIYLLLVEIPRGDKAFLTFVHAPPPRPESELNWEA